MHVGLQRKHHLSLYGKNSLISDKLSLLVMTLPAFLLVIVFSYLPIFGWVYGFFDYKVGMKLSQSEFRGLYFFKLAFTDPYLLKVLKNTFALSLLGMIVIPLSAVFAILLSEIKSDRFRKLVQTVSTIPYFISWILVFAIFFSIFSSSDGVMNEILIKYNVLKDPVDPLANPDIAWALQTVIRIWKELGYTAIIFFAAITGIDTELYDAAKVDGAGRFRVIWHIVIPGLLPTMSIMLLIGVGFILSSGFEQYYVFMNPLIQDKIETLDYYFYRIGMMTDDIPFATALSMSRTLISATMVIFINWLAKRINGRSLI
jgi:ABC-type polysaccharide transport system, permease component